MNDCYVVYMNGIDWHQRLENVSKKSFLKYQMIRFSVLIIQFFFVTEYMMKDDWLGIGLADVRSTFRSACFQARRRHLSAVGPL